MAVGAGRVGELLELPPMTDTFSFGPTRKVSQLVESRGHKIVELVRCRREVVAAALAHVVRNPAEAACNAHGPVRASASAHG